MELSEPADNPYGSGELGSKYQGQMGPTPSRYWQNFTQDSAPVRGQSRTGSRSTSGN
jgi:dCTP deaminase